MSNMHLKDDMVTNDTQHTAMVASFWQSSNSFMWYIPIHKHIHIYIFFWIISILHQKLLPIEIFHYGRSTQLQHTFCCLRNCIGRWGRSITWILLQVVPHPLWPYEKMISPSVDGVWWMFKLWLAGVLKGAVWSWGYLKSLYKRERFGATFRFENHILGESIAFWGVSSNAGFPQQPLVFPTKKGSALGVWNGGTTILRKHQYGDGNGWRCCNDPRDFVVFCCVFFPTNCLERKGTERGWNWTYLWRLQCLQ